MHGRIGLQFWNSAWVLRLWSPRSVDGIQVMREVLIIAPVVLVLLTGMYCNTMR